MASFSKKTELIIGKDSYRRNFSRVYFNNGFLYVSNCHCLLKQKLSLFGFSEDQVDKLNGNSINIHDWSMIRKFKDHCPVDGGIDCVTKTSKVFYKFKNEEFEDQKTVESMEKVIQTNQKLENDVDSTFDLNVSLLNDLNEAMFLSADHLVFKTTGAKNAIIVFSEGSEFSIEDQIGLIMPVNIRN
tara:strand:- start:297 stop:854 length:558 start_codon:yes stop_codon:yes gene_type:complete